MSGEQLVLDSFEVPPPADEDRLTVDLGSWEGPLDLLLTLARTQKVDLREISILALVDQYLAYINDARALKLEIAADYLVMAAWLAYLKSGLLLPKDPEIDPSPEELALRLQLRLERLNAMRESGARSVRGIPIFTRDIGSPGSPLRVLVVGGSLGAKALNDTVPQALALIPADQRPRVIHQSGAKQIDALRASYAAAGVEATLTPFIDDTASAFAQADLVICRAGASTVTEIAAIGAAALFVPFPFAVDDHQTTNARFLVDQGGGWLLPQSDMTAQDLARRLQQLTRQELLACASRAHQQRKMNATREVVMACEELAA